MIFHLPLAPTTGINASVESFSLNQNYTQNRIRIAHLNLNCIYRAQGLNIDSKDSYEGFRHDHPRFVSLKKKKLRKY